MNKYLKHKKTGTVIKRKDRKTILFSYDDFIERIVKGDDCFICGESSDSKTFNNEHIIPNWILRAYGTEKSFMVLHNHTTINNSQYTVPCCQDCNTALAIDYETPISNLLKKTYQEIYRAVDSDENLYKKLFQWMCLLFFKTHLKDTYLPMERDKRKGLGTIGEGFCWHSLFHIHNIIRQHYSGAEIHRDVYGTLLIFKALEEVENQEFDYLDNFNDQIMMIQVGEVVILAILNDSRFCFASARGFLKEITGALSAIQIRELFARLRYLNINIKNRPEYYSLIDSKGLTLSANLPEKIEILLGDNEKVSLYKLIRFYFDNLISPDMPDREALLISVEEGKLGVIFDENGNFVQHPGYAG